MLRYFGVPELCCTDAGGWTVEKFDAVDKDISSSFKQSSWQGESGTGGPSSSTSRSGSGNASARSAPVLAGPRCRKAKASFLMNEETEDFLPASGIAPPVVVDAMSSDCLPGKLEADSAILAAPSASNFVDAGLQRSPSKASIITSSTATPSVATDATGLQPSPRPSLSSFLPDATTAEEVEKRGELEKVYARLGFFNDQFVSKMKVEPPPRPPPDGEPVARFPRPGEVPPGPPGLPRKTRTGSRSASRGARADDLVFLGL
eukprot:TRINITY_DN20826_c0_g1_i2.p1 TRINITY_DN20826_c0_g1~~TRINITY_DN20826_c0_g1_i2.p1  ORF type:complete len:261 (+),score=55.26 TRINITY_DN20826_c0_g1_i2:146-928(+)